jgi:hypothetical protein
VAHISAPKVEKPRATTAESARRGSVLSGKRIPICKLTHSSTLYFFSFSPSLYLLRWIYRTRVDGYFRTGIRLRCPQVDASHPSSSSSCFGFVSKSSTIHPITEAQKQPTYLWTIPRRATHPISSARGVTARTIQTRRRHHPYADGSPLGRSGPCRPATTN